MTLIDLDGPMIKAVGPAIGMNTSGGSLQVDIVVDMVDKCFRQPTGTANLFDIVEIDKGNGTRVTMRQEILNNTVNQIQKQFKEALSTNGSPEQLATSPEFLAFIAVLKDNPVSTWIIPQTSMSTKFPNLYSDTSMKAAATSCYCADFTPKGIGDTAQSLQGLSAFGMALLKGNVATGQPNGYVCDPPTTVQWGVTCAAGSDQVCSQGNDFMAIKKTLTGSGTDDTKYSCPIFALPSDPTKPCDPNTQTSPLDCVDADGKVEVLQQSCTMTEFQTYMTNFGDRLDKVFTEVDKATSTSADKINVNLYSLVDKAVVDPILLLIEGAQCNFLGKSYDGMLDAFCYQGTFGLTMISSAYVSLGFLTALLVLEMYVLYRRAIDNHEFTCRNAGADGGNRA